MTNLTFYVNKIIDYPIGREPENIPDFVRNNKGIIMKGGVDNLCLFRCLAIHENPNGDARWLSKQTNAYLDAYIANLELSDKYEFPGVKLSELLDFENIFNIGVQVYTLCLENEIVVAKLVRRPVAKYDDTLRVSLQGAHFYYIKNFSVYSSKFACNRCGKLWKSSWICRRHERTCKAKIMDKYPVGPYC